VTGLSTIPSSCLLKARWDRPILYLWRPVYPYIWTQCSALAAPETEEGHNWKNAQVTTADQDDCTQAEVDWKIYNQWQKLDTDLTCPNLQTLEMNCDIWIMEGMVNISHMSTTHWQFLKGGRWLPGQSKALMFQP